MASASVTALGGRALATVLDEGEIGLLGSLGRFRANGPVAAHLWSGMRRIPLGVVLALARIPKGTVTTS